MRLTTTTALAALLLGGCGGGQTAAQSPATTGAAATTTTKAQSTEAKADVKITTCAHNGWTQDVVIEVTNSTSDAAKYVVGIDILDASGKAVSEAR